MTSNTWYTVARTTDSECIGRVSFSIGSSALVFDVLVQYGNISISIVSAVVVPDTVFSMRVRTSGPYRYVDIRTSVTDGSTPSFSVSQVLNTLSVTSFEEAGTGTQECIITTDAWAPGSPADEYVTIGNIETITALKYFTDGVAIGDRDHYHTLVYGNDGVYLGGYRVLTTSDSAGYVTTGSYNSTTKKIELKHGSTVLAEIDATDFIKDGMVDSVTVEDGYLVITFNADSGKEPISVELSDFFDADDYYDKSDIDTLLAGYLPLTGGTITGNLKVNGVTELVSALIIPASAPSSPVSGKTYIYAGSGSYGEEPSGGVGEVYKLILKKGATTLGTYEPDGGEDQTIDIANAFNGYATQTWVTTQIGNIDLTGYVPTTRKVNGKALSSDITLGLSDVATKSDIKTMLGDDSYVAYVAGPFTAWGQTYWNNGAPQSISGSLTSVTDITGSGKITIPKGKFASLLMIPSSAPSSGDVVSGETYIYSGTGSYGEEASGGISDVSTLTITINGSSTVYDPAGDDASVSFGSASQKAYTGTIESNGTGLPTAGAVYTYVNNSILAAQPYKGVSSTAITDGGTEMPTITGYTTRTHGDVVAYDKKEFIWDTNDKWRLLGDEGSYALKTTSVIAGTGLSGGGQISQDVTLNLSSATITSLGKADTAYQKPSGGIPDSDLADAYLKLSGNSVATKITGDVYMTRGKYLKMVESNGTDSVNLLGISSSGAWFTLGNSSYRAEISSNNSDILHIKNGISYAVYDESNLTKSVLTTLLESDNGYYVKKAGDTMTGDLTFDASSANRNIYWKYGSNVTASALRMNSDGSISIGANQTSNYKETYINGNSTYITFNGTRQVQFTGNTVIPNSNNVLSLGTSSLRWSALYSKGANLDTFLAIPQSAPSTSASWYSANDAYLYADTSGNYSESAGGGVANVYPLTITINGTSTVYNPGSAAQTVSFGVPTSAQISAWNAKYDKPSGGIPGTDLATAYLPLTGGTLTGSLTITNGGCLAIGSDYLDHNSSHDMIWYDGTARRTVWHSGNFTPSNYLPLTGGTVTGDLTVSGYTTLNKAVTIASTTAGNFNEGLRISRASNSWAGITLGSTGNQGMPSDGWFVATNPDKQFLISAGDSSNASGICLVKGGDAKWRNNVILHAGNYNSYALPLSGGTMTGAAPIVFTPDKIAINFRIADSYQTKVKYSTYGNEALMVSTKNSVTSIILNSGTDLTDSDSWASSFSASAPPSMQIKNKSVYINKFIASGANPAYNLYVGGPTYFEGEATLSLNSTFSKNISDIGTSGWSRDILQYKVDGSSKFQIGAYGSYTQGGSSNTISYAYIGCNAYNGVNLRFYPDGSLLYGTNTVYHSGNLALSTLVGSTSAIGATNRPVFYNGSNLQICSPGESFISWGGADISGNFSPIDASMVGLLGANRLAFMPAAGITVQYSRDGGSTWTDYGHDDGNKINFFNENGTVLYIGKASSSSPATVNYQLRVRITTPTINVYTVLNKFVVYVTTNGSGSCWCTIKGRTVTNHDNNVDTWTTFKEKAPISGWSGYNVINTSGITVGNGASQIRDLDFIFGCDNVDSVSSTYYGLIVRNVLGFGGVGWSTPSYMASRNRLYTYDSGQNMLLPAGLYPVSHDDSKHNIGSTSRLWYAAYVHYVCTNNINALTSNPITVTTSSNNTFILNSTASANNYLYFKQSGVSEAAVGYYNNFAFISNEKTSSGLARIGITDTGLPQYWPASSNTNAKTLIHEGNTTLITRVNGAYTSYAGGYSFGSGYQSYAIGSYSTSIGYSSQARGNNAVTIGFNSRTGYDTGDTSKPNVVYVGYVPEVITYGGSSVYGIWHRYNDSSSVTFTYSGTNYTVNWPSSNPNYWRLMMLVKMQGDMIAPTVYYPLYRISMLSDNFKHTGAVYPTQVTEITTGVYAIISEVIDYSATYPDSYPLTSSTCRLSLPTKTSSGGYTGASCVAAGHQSTAYGYFSGSYGYFSVASGRWSGAYSCYSMSFGDYSLALAYGAQSWGNGTVALGYKSVSVNARAIAVGYQSVAYGSGAVAIGEDSIAEGTGSYTLAYNCKATGSYSLAMGMNSTASGHYSVAMGAVSKSANTGSFVQAWYGESGTDYQTVLGVYNVKDTSSILVVGKGTSDSARKNIMTLGASGNLTLADGGNLVVGSQGGGAANIANYISAGRSYGTGAGRYGVKVLTCDQLNCQSGLGQDLACKSGWSNNYNHCMVACHDSHSKISFVTHPVNSTTYTYLGGFSYTNSGAVIEFAVNGKSYLPQVEVDTSLAVPTAAPSSPTSGKVYMWIGSTGTYVN